MPLDGGKAEMTVHDVSSLLALQQRQQTLRPVFLNVLFFCPREPTTADT